MKHLTVVMMIALLMTGCGGGNNPLIKIEGSAQGTTYHITWVTRDSINYKAAIDSLLKAIDSSLSTYLSTSLVSRMNRNDTTVVADRFFTDVFNRSIEVAVVSGGLFDITVAPVINAWGFGFTDTTATDSSTIDSLLNFVGYKNLRLKDGRLLKAMPGVQLDFNAIAQGYSVDLLAEFLDSMGIDDYLVELGGEVKAKGKKNQREYWKVGIDQPNEIPSDERPLQAIVQLQNKALATSGNYRKFYEVDGRKIAHIIHPRTGYPAKHTLLSATVIADDCATADAYATVFMVMGLEASLQFIAAHPVPALEVFFIYDNKGEYATYTSKKLRPRISAVK